MPAAKQAEGILNERPVAGSQTKTRKDQIAFALSASRDPVVAVGKQLNEELACLDRVLRVRSGSHCCSPPDPPFSTARLLPSNDRSALNSAPTAACHHH